MVVGNRELIGQAVANLIDNAVKYGGGAEGGARQGADQTSRCARRERLFMVAIEVS